MAKSHKPIIWGPFAAGGTFAALVTPVLIFITGVAEPLGLLPTGALSYERAHVFADMLFGKFVLSMFVILPIWHAAHRARIAVHDFGVRADMLTGSIMYTIAIVTTAAVIIAVLRV